MRNGGAGRLGLVCSLAVAISCGNGRESDDGPPLDCLDPDGDGFGEGPECFGSDCLEGDGSEHVCGCDAADFLEGCSCDPATAPMVCYDAAPETAGVAACMSGLLACSQGFWTGCQGQVLPANDICNGLDDDCDGETDEDLDACDWCGTNCHIVGWGPDREPFVAEGPGLAVGADGALEVTGVSPGPRLIWVAGTLDGTISKVDTRTLLELGRYRTGPLGASASAEVGPGDVPIAVAVAPNGDALVVNRAPTSTATALRIQNGACPAGDDGRVDTSTGSDVLPWTGEGPADDCIVWSTVFAGAGERGTSVLYDVREGLDGARMERVWAGSDAGLVELDGASGAPTGIFWPLPIAPLSAAIDAAGDPWILGPGAHELVRIDAETGVFEGVPLPLGENAQALWIDERGDVWTAGAHVLRYRRGEAAFDVAADSAESDGGIVVDASGVAWTTSTNGIVQRVESQAGDLVTSAIEGVAGVGIAVDHDGAIFAVSSAVAGGMGRIDPFRVANGAEACCDFLAGSLARGDLTGAPRFDGLDAVSWTGRYAPGDDDCPTTYGALDVHGRGLEGSTLTIEARVAPTADALDEATFQLVVATPPGTLPASVGDALGGADGPALDVRITIDPVDADELPVIEEVTVERASWCF